jgi:hypothetical protein
VCWDWRKLGRPAATYWTKAIENLFSNENGAGPDSIDWEQWAQWGMTESVTKALYTLKALQQAYDAEINWHKEDRAR